MNRLRRARADVLHDSKYQIISYVSCIFIVRLSSQGKKAVIRMLGMSLYTCFFLCHITFKLLWWLLSLSAGFLSTVKESCLLWSHYMENGRSLFSEPSMCCSWCQVKFWNLYLILFDICIGVFYYFNSILNPILYTVLSKRFRRGFNDMTDKCWICEVIHHRFPLK